MSSKNNKIKNRIISNFTTLSSFLIPFIQYVPATGIWFGIMSIPLITYITFFFQNPNILINDIQFVFGTYGFYIVIFGAVIFLYSLIYQLTHRKQLIQQGPYRLMRHPQYFAFIIMTLGMTIITFQTSPIFDFVLYNIDGHTLIFLIWIGETITYILLAKIEDFALKAKYGDDFIEYANSVSFLIPFLKFKPKHK